MRACLAIAVVALASCGPGEQQAQNDTASAAPPKKHPTYCFFKDAETRGWAASRDAAGNITVKGSAYRSDPRYKAEVVDTEVSPPAASLWVAIGPNQTGFAAPGNWWDVTSTIPDSKAIETVTVRCGKRVLAELRP